MMIAVIALVATLILAEILRPYRLRLEARCRAWERAQYEKMAEAEERQAETERDLLVREVRLNTARDYRSAAEKVRL